MTCLQAVGLFGAAGAGGACLALSLERSVAAADADRFAHVPNMHWPHQGPFDAYDAKSIRRGYEVRQLVVLGEAAGSEGGVRQLVVRVVLGEVSGSEGCTG